MSDADCIPGREPCSVAASKIYFFIFIALFFYFIIFNYLLFYFLFLIFEQIYRLEVKYWL